MVEGKAVGLGLHLLLQLGDLLLGGGKILGLVGAEGLQAVLGRGHLGG